jgi:hypothetical protein
MATVIRPTRVLDQSSPANISEYWNKNNPFPAHGSFGMPPSIDSELQRILSLKGIDAKESITWKYLIGPKQFEITNVDGDELQQPMYITPSDSAIFVAGRKKRSIKRKGNKKKIKRTHGRKYK